MRNFNEDDSNDEHVKLLNEVNESYNTNQSAQRRNSSFTSVVDGQGGDGETEEESLTLTKATNYTKTNERFIIIQKRASFQNSRINERIFFIF